MAAAAEVAASGKPTTVGGPFGGALRLSVEPAPPNTSQLAMQTSPVDEGWRLARQLINKARQTVGAINVWIRVDVRSGLWTPLTEWGRAPLDRKAEQIAVIVRGALAEHPHVAGAVLSTGLLFAAPGIETRTLASPDGTVTLRRTIPGNLGRETIIVPRASGETADVADWQGWYGAEPSWLDWALAELGHPPLSTLVTFGN